MVIKVLQEALNDAISCGKFIDTKIILFSRRDSSGRICKPRALYANSHVLKSVPYFNDREFPSHPPVMRIDLLLKFSLVHFPNRRSRTSLSPLTMASLQRTTAILQTVTLKRIGILKVPLPGDAN